jgi:hypothetical protein
MVSVPFSWVNLVYIDIVCSNGRQTVGDGAFSTDVSPRVVAVCHMQGNSDLYYYSTTFSGGPEVCFLLIDALKTRSYSL